MATIHYRKRRVGDVDVLYREAGPSDAPVVLLLHGFPTASHMFRDPIPLLTDRYRLIAPDLPGFGQTKAPPRGTFDYTFDRLADVIEGFTGALSLDRYALYIFDYGAPVGLRLGMRHPERVSAIISQNGNAYIDGFSDQWETKSRRSSGRQRHGKDRHTRHHKEADGVMRWHGKANLERTLP